MSQRAWRAAHRVATAGGILAALVAVLLDGGGEPGRPAALAGATAFAQSPGVRYRVVAERSEVRYRVREQLVGLDLPNDAVGVTRAIEGGVALDPQGRVVPGDSRLTVDLRTLESDQVRRDRFLRRNTLDTDRFPTAVFVPIEIRGLRLPLPQAGSATFEVLGDFTVREATRRLTWEASATFGGEDVGIRARTAFRFPDFGLPIPRVSVVLSVEDNIRLEADLLLRPA
jgi:polyisoprenoid-binding protein YceI